MLQETHLFFQQLQLQVAEKELLVKLQVDLEVEELIQMEHRVEQEIHQQQHHHKEIQVVEVQIILGEVEEELPLQDKMQEDQIMDHQNMVDQEEQVLQIVFQVQH
jgi:hypothetical protein